MTSLDYLKETGTIVVTDTGEFPLIAKYTPQDATTNPSLILAAASKPEYSGLIDVALEYGIQHGKSVDSQVDLAMDRLLVEFGKQILDIIPGRVSTEVDARLSFDTKGTVKKALELIAMYESIGVDKDRVLIKIASTWEGIQAAKILEEVYDVHCNLTLLFSFVQAVACAEAGVTLISPFVGRILDWYKAKTGQTYSGADDPGVQSVREIFSYYKKFRYTTIVMGASFRSVDEIEQLAGCDYLTISPKLLDELMKSKRPIDKKLDAKDSNKENIVKLSVVDDEPRFRLLLNDNAMATEKLSEGIRGFCKDYITLLDLLKKRIVGSKL